MCPRCMLAGLLDGGRADALPDRAGTQIGRYTLVEKLGDGGMGAVWRAAQTEPVRRDVAVKLIKLGMDTRELVSRFEAERQVLASLDHPNIAEIFDAGSTETGRPYYVMELVDGLPITDYCEQNQLSTSARLALFKGVCKAVQHAHERGVVHRDLKPTNILVADHHDHQLKVIDFGIAKATGSEFAEQTVATRSGQIVGTPGYMSPEQAAGESDVDRRADVYSLGAVLYELLAGSPPFGEDQLRAAGLAEVLRIIREDDPPKPSTRASSIGGTAGRAPPPPDRHLPGELDWIVMQALAKEPARRYQSAEALAEDLRRHLEHEPISAAAPTLRYRTGKFVRKHRVGVAAVVSVLTAIALGTFAALTQAHRATLAEGGESSARSEARDTLASSYAATALGYAEAGDHGRALLWFTKASNAADDPVARHRYRTQVAAWSRERFKLVRAFRSSAIEVRDLRFHPGGRFLICSANDGSSMWDLETEEEVSFVDAEGIPYGLAWNPAGDTLAVWRRSGVVSVLGWPGREPLFEVQARKSFSGTFSADGSLLAVGGAGGFEVWSVAERRLLCQDALGAGAQLHNLVLSDAGDRLLCHDYGKSVFVFPIGDLDGGEAEPLFPPLPSEYTPAYRFVAEGSQFVLYDVFGNGSMSLLETDTGRQVREISQRSFGAAVGVETPHEGLCLAGEAGRLKCFLGHGEREIFSIPLDGLPLCSALVPGRMELLYGTRRGTIARHSTDANLAPHGALGMLSRHRLTPSGIAASPDGRLAAVGAGGGLVRIFELARPLDSDLVHVIPKHDGSNVALDPGGNHFATAGASRAGKFPPRTRVHRLADGEPVGPLLELGGSPVDALFTAGGDALVVLTSAAETREFNDPTMFLGEGRAGSVEHWDWRSGERLGASLAMPSEPRDAQWFPGDSSRLAVFCAGGQVVDVNLESRAVTPLFQTTSSPAGGDRHNGALAFSPDGTALVAFAMGIDTTGGHAFVWDVAAGQLRFDPLLHDPEEYCHAIAFHPGEPVLCTASGSRAGVNHIRFWSLVDGSQAAPPIAEPGITRVVRFLDGDRLLFGGNNRAAKVVDDWRTGGIAAVSLRLRGPLMATAPVPGRPGWLVSTSGESYEESFAYLWDSRSGDLLAPPIFLDVLRPHGIDLSPDGRKVLLSGGARTSVWDISFLDSVEPLLPQSGAVLLAELEAGAAALESGGDADLDTEAWLARWREFRRVHPEHLSLGTSGDE